MNAQDEIWSYGDREIESAVFGPSTGKIWVTEMGPLGGDELNKPVAGRRQRKSSAYPFDFKLGLHKSAGLP